MFGFFKKDKAVEVEVPTQVPAHISIIMDGNGRWAKKRMQPRVLDIRRHGSIANRDQGSQQTGRQGYYGLCFFYGKLDPSRSGSQVYHELASRVL